MNANDIALVQHAFNQIRPISITTAALFYGRLFELNPDLQPLFKNSLEVQSKKLMDMLLLAIDSLDTAEQLVTPLHELGQRHAQYGVQPEDYQLVADALTWTLATMLGDEFDAATQAAWANVYDWMAEIMLAEPAPLES